jgi:hypothetical protein
VITPMNADQARIADPILTQHARGYRNANFVATALFPEAPVPVRGFKRIQFGNESFRLYSTRRAPGGAVQEIQFGFTGATVNLEQHAIAAKVPVEHAEEAAKVPAINMQRASVTLAQDAIALAVEYQSASVARNPSNYAASNLEDLSGDDCWDDPDSKPDELIDDHKETIRSRTGMTPNTLLLPPPAARKLRRHPRLKSLYSAEAASRPLTLDELAKALEIDRIVVGGAMYANSADDFVDVWGADAILAYVSPRGDYQTPSYGYTYRLAGHPAVKAGRYDDKHNSWIYPVFDECSPELVGADAGVLIRNVLTQD